MTTNQETEDDEASVDLLWVKGFGVLQTFEFMKVKKVIQDPILNACKELLSFRLPKRSVDLKEAPALRIVPSQEEIPKN